MADLNHEQFLTESPLTTPPPVKPLKTGNTLPVAPNRVIPVDYLYDLWTD